ncbi:AarF/ABC1/UbiB kinase family protein [Vibrio sp. SS-MA-C1-2]|uniref:ABC1 kinase family protein n=1 Tax=Vibrio sp. SS-MA-C1-2 TaxID=2908646 RepID=UPI001F21A231|nr:AarF/ABC1/UbiB kinase family protein [Vibrio sp. SS-MA-C1-2]UJF17908.1 AarF/ABC1/UbiB kinase family protein [Vibrio sp. SS-MA-C1-2]
MSKKERDLPTNRISRFGNFASLATRVAGNVIKEGSKQLAQGNKPQIKDLLLTPGNIQRLTDQLAHLRGAAMKLGQMLSMDAGDILDPELAKILARLRSDADPMPAKQLSKTMEQGLGEDWKSLFLSFTYKPLASASIGQVHQAHTDDGDRVAVKVQYPGVKNSIDSDVNNVGTLLNVVGLIPKGVNYQELLEDAKIQLHDEADYLREADFAQQYKTLLNDNKNFIVPDIYPECSCDTVLTMTFIDGVAIESLVDEPQEVKDRVLKQLITLFFRELFEFKMVQTDPNYANYLYCKESGRVALLDFGATRVYSEKISEGYRVAFRSVLEGDKVELNRALEKIGFFSQDIVPEQRETILDLVVVACEPVIYQDEFDFKNSDLSKRLQDAGKVLSLEQNYWHTPPSDALFLHRKIGGMYLLASHLGSRVNVHELLLPHLYPDGQRG